MTERGEVTRERRMLSYLTPEQIAAWLNCDRGSVKVFWPGHAKEHLFGEYCLRLKCPEKGKADD